MESHAAVELPDAPRPQIEVTARVSSEELDTLADGQQSGSGSSSSAQQDSTQQPQQKTEHQIGDAQIKEQESQRVAGVVPSFNVSYRPDAVA